MRLNTSLQIWFGFWLTCVGVLIITSSNAVGAPSFNSSSIRLPLTTEKKKTADPQLPRSSHSSDLASLLKELHVEDPASPTLEVEGAQEAQSLNAKGFSPWLLER
ncbi:MAG: hypothetical protein NDI61_07790 [Bdellovibrionaceae bacterium]|nr:hypothetical protein [Pseudobdellovibrionaceae bacterium]